MTLSLGLPGIRRDPGDAPSTVGRPPTDALVDQFGREARDLRISVTEKCSLRCVYCMPEAGLPAIPREQLLTAGEISRLVGIAVRHLGVRDIRFTGGEPLMRADLEEIVGLSSGAISTSSIAGGSLIAGGSPIAGGSSIAGGVSISMTTNAIGLDKRIDGLVAAGLNRINISLDTVDRDHFARLTRRDRLPAVFAGIEAAKRAGIAPLKINAVLMRDTLAGAADLLEWSLNNGAQLRFIEQMPLDADETWVRDNMVDAAELLDVLGARFALSEPHRDDPSAPAEEWLVDGGPSTVGIIASVTRSFCDACDRTRLTAEGTVRSCLFGDDETDLRGLLRGGADDAVIADRWRAAQWHKQQGHGISRPDFVRPLRSMGAIGG